MTQNSERKSGRQDRDAARRSYVSPVLQRFGAVTELTNSAAGSCQDDSATNVCPPNKAMQMQGVSGQ